jgi:hypothetical protein
LFTLVFSTLTILGVEGVARGQNQCVPTGAICIRQSPAISAIPPIVPQVWEVIELPPLGDADKNDIVNFADVTSILTFFDLT